jgi:hypothetical protein
MNKQTIITILFTLVAMAGQAQIHYRRHYTTDYTDIIVLNQMRPRDFLCRIMFNI